MTYLYAGLLGMAPDDPRIPFSLQLAKEAGLEVNVHSITLRDAHPNTALMTLTGSRGRTVTVSASSLGGGRIRVNSIDGLEAAFSGDLPTLVIRGKDEPGVVSEVSACLARRDANIATMQLYRDRRGGLSVTVIECDQPVSEEILEDIDLLGGVVRCKGDEALLARVLYRLTARRGQFPPMPALGSRLYLLGRESVAQRPSAARLYVAEALAEEDVNVTDVQLGPAGEGRMEVTVSLEYRGTDLTVTMTV